MSARDNILARIRRAQGRTGGEPTEAEMARVREVIAHPVTGPVPARVGAHDAVLAFRGECDRVGTTHHEVHGMAEVPSAIAAWLDANELPRRIVGWHAFASLGWEAAGIAFDDRPANADDLTGLTGSFCGISETGTLLLLSAPDAPKVTALLPESHVAVVSRSRIVRTMEEAFAWLRAERGQPPRATWFVSGPSRTADIEQTVVIGAHGPYRTHVVIVP